jgi:hypothetical protein
MAATLCGAHARSTGLPCTRPVARGATRCRFHGGAAPQTKARVRQRVVEQDARRALARLDVAPVSDPLTALAALAGQAIAFKDQLAERVNELQAIRFTDDKGAEQLRSEVTLWERALDRCERFCTAMARLGIDERLARVEEAEAELVIAAIEVALDAAGVEPSRRADAKRAAATHLRLVV